MKKIILAFTLLTHISIFSQNGLNEFLNNVVIDGSLQDSEVLLEGYMSPFGSALGAGLNNGWYNTAKPHKLGGFSVTSGLGFILIPSSAETFNPSNNLNQFQIEGDPNIPTFFGPDNTSSEITFNGENLFSAQVGIDLPTLPVPYFQASIGGPKSTDILFRFVPKQIKSIENMEFKYWGIGFKHDLLQWIPVANKIPIDLSYLISYSKLSNTYNINQSGDKNLDFKVRGLNQYLCLSKKLSFITVYSGVGYQFSNSRLRLNGDYVLNNGIIITDPFDFNFGGVNGFKTDVGLRMKILLCTVHAQWTRAEYNIFTFGVSLTTDGLY